MPRADVTTSSGPSRPRPPTRRRAAPVFVQSLELLMPASPARRGVSMIASTARRCARLVSLAGVVCPDCPTYARRRGTFLRSLVGARRATPSTFLRLRVLRAALFNDMEHSWLLSTHRTVPSVWNASFPAGGNLAMCWTSCAHRCGCAATARLAGLAVRHTRFHCPHLLRSNQGCHTRWSATVECTHKPSTTL